MPLGNRGSETTTVLKSASPTAMGINETPFINSLNVARYILEGRCGPHDSAVTITVGGQAPMQPVSCANGGWRAEFNLETTAVPDSAAVAIAGSYGTVTLAANSVVKDTLPPTVTLPTVGEIDRINDGAYELSGGCSENDRSVDVTIGNLPFSTTCQNLSWQLVANVSTLPPGSVAISITHSELAGNPMATASATVGRKDAVIIEITTAPSVNSDNESNYEIGGICSENGQTVAVELNDSGSGILSASATCGSFAWIVTGLNMGGLADGQVQITATHGGATKTTMVKKGCATGGSGANGDDPITICNYNDLRNIANGLEKHYILGTNIDARASWSEGAPGCTPYDGSSVAAINPCSGLLLLGQFSGSLDGKDYQISNLYINIARDNGGLFAQTSSSATIKNVHLRSILVKNTGNNTGGLIGQANDGRVENCSVTGRIVGRDSVGGLVGRGYGIVEIVNSYADVTVTGNSFLGALVGTNEHKDRLSYFAGFISNSYTRGAVTGTGASVGGIIGIATNAPVFNSHAHVAVSGSFGVGSLIGVYYVTTDDNVRNSYGVGPVSGSEDSSGPIGGLIGGTSHTEDYFSVNVINGFWDIVTTGQATSAISDAQDTSTVGGLTTEQMQVACTDGVTTGICALGTGFYFEAGSYPKVKKCLSNCDSNSPTFSDEFVAGQGGFYVGISSSDNILAATVGTYVVEGFCSEDKGDVVLMLTDSANVERSPSPQPTCDGRGKWSVVINVSGLSDGNIRINATHQNKNGNSVSAREVTVVKDIQVPNIAITNFPDILANTVVGSYQFGGTCDQADREIALVLTDSTGVPASLPPVNCPHSGQWSTQVDVGPLAEGEVTMTASYTDSAGNLNEDTRRIEKDTNAPILSVVNPQHIFPSTETSYALAGICSEDGQNIAVTFSDSLANPLSLSFQSTCQNGAWSGAFNVGNLTAGNVSVVTTHSDSAGNEIRYPFEVVKSALSVTLTIESVSDINISNKDNYILQGTCSPDGGNLTILVAEVSPSNPIACSVGRWQTSFNFNDGSDFDDSTITVDYSSNGENAPQIMRTISRDTVAPTVAIANSSNILHSTVEHYLVGGNCSEEGIEVTVELTDSVEEKKYPANQPICNGSDQWAVVVDASSLNQGNIAIDATHQDAAGNSTNADRVEVIKDVILPHLSIDTPSGIGLSSQGNYLVAGACDETGSAVTVKLTDGTNIRSPSGPVLCQNNNRWSANINTTGLGDGSITITASIADGHGNINEQEALAIKDVVAPILAIDFPAAATDDNETKYPVAGTCDEFLPITVRAGGHGPDTIPNCYGGIWRTLIDVSDLEDGVFLITASQTDSVGNEVNARRQYFIKGGHPRTMLLENVGVGNSHSCALLSGQVKCWGEGRDGRLGNDGRKLTGHYDDHYTSVTVKMEGPNGPVALSNIVQLSTGMAHNCGLDSNGRVWCWGRNSNSQLGVNSGGLEKDIAIVVKSYNEANVLLGFVQVSAGGTHTCALRSNGQVWCWGESTLLGGTSIDDISTQQGFIVRDGFGHNLRGFIQVSAGASHTCGLRFTGRVWCWGKGQYGQLGNGEIANQNYASPVHKGQSDSSPLSGVIQINSGREHTCGLLSDGTIKCWGRGNQGRLGDGDNMNHNSLYPVVVRGSDNAVNSSLGGVVQISAGGSHSCALSTGGGGWCWGNRGYGRLGSGDLSEHLPYPAAVTVLEGGETVAFGEMTQIIAGAYHSCARTWHGRAYCWGNGGNGRLGNGGTANRSHPTLVVGFSDIGEFQRSYTCTVDGSSCALNNVDLALGPGIASLDNDASPSIEVSGIGAGETVTLYSDSACSTSLGSASEGNSTVALSGLEDGTHHFYFKLGEGSECSKNFLTYVLDTTPPPTPGIALAVSQGADWSPTVTVSPVHTGDIIAVYSDSSCQTAVAAPVVAEGTSVEVEVNSLGSNGAYQFYATASNSIGNVSACSATSGTYTLTLRPIYLLGETISGGGSHSCGVKPGGGVSCWGRGTEGQLGHGMSSTENHPVDVISLDNGVQVSSGNRHSCALKSDGSVYCWGEGDNGRLGNAQSEVSSAPVEVSALEGVVQISAGESHTCALKGNGSVWCWGSGGDGRLGNGQSTESNTPVEVSGPGEVMQISAGESHTCALVSDGSVACWGKGSAGQLGDNTGVGRSRPVSVVSGQSVTDPLGSVVQVAAGGSHSCALRADGGVLCWGAGDAGQLGEGQTSGRNYPVPVSSLSNATQVSLGQNFSCALKSDGGVSCWGRGTEGQLGQSTDSSSPVAVAWDNSNPLGGVAQISSGSAQTCAQLKSGGVKCWGQSVGHHPATVVEDSSALITFNMGSYRRSYSCLAESSQCTLGRIDLALGTGVSSPSKDNSSPSIGVAGIPSGETFTLYSDGTCNTVVGSAIMGVSSGTVSVSTLAEGTHSFHFTTTSAPDCSKNFLTYVFDSVAPSTPTLTLSVTSGDNATPSVQVSGVSPGDLINIYSDAACTTEAATPVRVDALSGEIVVSALTATGSYQFYAQATDAAGNVSACSVATADYDYTHEGRFGRSGLVHENL